MLIIFQRIWKFKKFKHIESGKEIENLTNLTGLNLGSNQFTVLNLVRNHLTELPNEIGNLINVISFDMRYNELTELPKEIGNLINLE
ncbi:hypothetical protein H8356DRAFT_1333277 [Neocallimastix lanati (nom. inval.)]|nr:hypothetical protein H8356DRAFT_1333277 [Neocallimastix sp. JGI-2020a]